MSFAWKQSKRIFNVSLYLFFDLRSQYRFEKLCCAQSMFCSFMYVCVCLASVSFSQAPTTNIKIRMSAFPKASTVEDLQNLCELLDVVEAVRTMEAHHNIVKNLKEELLNLQSMLRYHSSEMNQERCCQILRELVFLKASLEVLIF